MKSFNIAKGIKISLDSSTQGSIVPVTHNNLTNNLNHQYNVVSRNKFIKNLKAYASINSIAEAALPEINLEDTETEKLYKALDIEWNSPRKQIDLLIGTNNDWMNVGESSLLNPSGYPYRLYNLLDLLTDNLAFEFGDNINLAVKITDVGYGLLQDSDRVNIYGSYIEEIVIDDFIQEITNTTEKEVLLDAPQKILLDSNLQRKYVLIQNQSNKNIWVSLSNNVTKNSILILPNGHYEFSTRNIPYYDAISGYADYDVNVNVIESM